MKKFVNVLLISFVLFIFNSYAYAKLVPVEGTAECNIGDTEGLNESVSAAKEQAYEWALRNAAEKFGVYVETHTEVVDSVMTKDEIITMAAATLDVTWHDFFYGTVENKAFKITCKLKALVDTDKIHTENMVEKDQLLKRIAELEKSMREKEEENQKLKEQYKVATSENQKQKIQDAFNENQRQFLISKYEKDIDIYDLGKKINVQELMKTAQKLSEIDPQNASAFRATIFCFREQKQLQRVVDYCKNILKSKSSPILMIEAYTQLGDIYYNEYNEITEAKKYINLGIELVKKQYTKTEIEKFVNGSNVTIQDLMVVGKSNTIRELYILKSDIEDCNPIFSNSNDHGFYNKKYRTDW